MPGTHVMIVILHASSIVQHEVEQALHQHDSSVPSRARGFQFYTLIVRKAKTVLSASTRQIQVHLTQETVLMPNVLDARTTALTLMLIETLRILALDCFLRCASL